MCDTCFAMQYLVSILLCNHYAREERAGCFILIVYLLSCECKLPHGVAGLQYVIVVFSGLLGLKIALSIAAYPMIYLTYREQNSL